MRPRSKSGGGPPHSRTLHVCGCRRQARQRLGVRQPSGALASQRELHPAFSSLGFVTGLLAMAFIFFSAAMAPAESTNNLSDAEMQGRALTQKILAQLAQVPTENYTNFGVLTIRGKNGRVHVPVEFEVVAGQPWKSVYSTRITNGSAIGQDYFANFTVIHSPDQPNIYEAVNVNAPAGDTNAVLPLTNIQLMTPFARSDFWLVDLGLEFVHWPQQRVIKKEFYNNCACTVLECTNPNPSANNYSRVVCWIDNDSLGIVKAYAYDASGKELKKFSPKTLEKVNGQYQLKSMVMVNRQTDSTSVLEFDLDK